MILEPRQRNRFHKLYDSLTMWVAAELGEVNKKSQAQHLLTEDLALKINSCIWGKDGDLALIDRFIAANPARLSRTDLREVESWKSGLYEDFAVMRNGRDILFLLGEHAFAVRGLTVEVDKIARRMPAFIQTAIIPFDGLITFADVLSISEVPVPDKVEESIVEDALICDHEGKIARSARDFVAVAPLAMQEEIEKRQNLDPSSADEANDEGAIDATAVEDTQESLLHRGVLAGLTWEERDAAIDAHASDHKSSPELEEIIRIQFDEWCDQGKIARTLEDAYMHLTKKELMHSAKIRNIQGNLKSMSRAKLVKAIVAYANVTAQDALVRAIAEGSYQIRHLRAVWEAGGMLRIPCEDVHKINDVPMPCFPATLLYHKGDEYIVSMPKEVYEALEGVDWEQELKTAKDVDRAVTYLDTLVNFRGVVPLAEGIQELSKQFPSLNPELLHLAIVSRVQNERVGFEMVRNDQDEFFIVDIDIARHSDVSEDGTVGNYRLIRNVLRQQGDKPARPIDGFLPNTYVFDYLRNKGSFRDLVAYLDAHVPEGANDYMFADRVMEDFVYFARDTTDVNVLFDILDDEGFVPTEEQAKELLELFYAFMNDIPRWTNNGWSANEIAFM